MLAVAPMGSLMPLEASLCHDLLPVEDTLREAYPNGVPPLPHTMLLSL
jgi:hypothetical protein